MLKFLVISSLALSALIILICFLKTKRFFTCLFLSFLQGIVSLFAVNAIGMVTGLHLSVNKFTVIASIIGGTPAVIGMTILDFLFR